jgi:predicted Zn finger-like uncharacterized protein
MRIVCPGCEAEYDVPAERLSGRRTVRCARCGQSFTPAVLDPPPPPPPPSPEPALEPATARVFEPAVMRNPPALRTEAPLARPSQPRGAGRMLAVSWASSVLVVIAVCAVALIDHAALAAAWPPLHRLYAAIGIER